MEVAENGGLISFGGQISELTSSQNIPWRKPTVRKGGNSGLQGERKRHTPPTEHVGDAECVAGSVHVLYGAIPRSRIQEGRRVCALEHCGGVEGVYCMVLAVLPGLKMTLSS